MKKPKVFFMEDYTFEQLSKMSADELEAIKTGVLRALDDQREEKYRLIGQIMFYTKLYKNPA